MQQFSHGGVAAEFSERTQMAKIGNPVAGFRKSVISDIRIPEFVRPRAGITANVGGQPWISLIRR